MSKKIIFLVNPISGTVQKQGVVELIKKETTARKIPFEIYPTNAEGEYSALKQKINSEKFTHVGIVGGDGTVNQVVNALKESNLEFGILPMGSGNGLALTAGISKNIPKALQLLFDGKSKKIDAFRINGQFACMLSGLGFDAQVAHDFANKASRGLMTYARQTLINYFAAKCFPFEIEVEGFKFYTNAFFISIANSNQFGNRVTIAPKASLSDGLLDIVIVQKMNKAFMPFAVFSQLRGTNKVEKLTEQALKKNIIYLQTDAIKISNPNNAPLHIDGEPKQTSQQFEVKVIEDCFRLIQP
jgi:YegS/Rv2252/BmrU family lipid kinase